MNVSIIIIKRSDIRKMETEEIRTLLWVITKPFETTMPLGKLRFGGTYKDLKQAQVNRDTIRSELSRRRSKRLKKECREEQNKQIGNLNSNFYWAEKYTV